MVRNKSANNGTDWTLLVSALAVFILFGVAWIVPA